ncbi:MAG: hypothetical protein M3Q83_01380 [Pseudomonadota bacterium]|nr:hypothetical protein [Pseudomonadota bacterium]
MGVVDRHQGVGAAAIDNRLDIAAHRLDADLGVGGVIIGPELVSPRDRGERRRADRIGADGRHRRHGLAEIEGADRARDGRGDRNVGVGQDDHRHVVGDIIVHLRGEAGRAAVDVVDVALVGVGDEPTVADVGGVRREAGSETLGGEQLAMVNGTQETHDAGGVGIERAVAGFDAPIEKGGAL